MSKGARWSFFAVISSGLLMVGLDNSILYTGLPAFNEQLHTDSTQQLWIINAYALVLADLLLGTGTPGDKIGHRRMFVYGLWIFGAASLAAAFAPSAWALVAARAVLGLGATIMMPATLVLIRLTFHDEVERNTTIGIWASVAVVGVAAGPTVGGLLLEHFWWGAVFLINVPIVLIALVATRLLAPPNITNPDKHWDLISSLLALATLSNLVMAIKSAASTEPNWGMVAGTLIVCAIGGLFFARRQRQLTEPLLTFDVFRSPVFTGGVLAAGGAMFAMTGVEMTTTQKLQLVDGFSLLQEGLVVSAMDIAAVAYNDGYMHTLCILAAVTVGFAAFTAYCFRHNPKSGDYVGSH